MGHYGQKASKVVDVYKSKLADLHTQVANAAYDEIVKAAAEGFSDGWIQAILWMNEYLDGNMLSDEKLRGASLKAKDEMVNDKYRLDLLDMFKEKDND